MESRKERPTNQATRKTLMDFKKTGIFFLALVLLPSFIFLDMGNLFGEYALIKLIIVSGVGGGVGSALSAENTKEKLVALIPGVIMGVGVPLAISAYLLLSGRESLLKFEVVTLAVLGIGPGYLFRRLLVRSNLFYQ